MGKGEVPSKVQAFDACATEGIPQAFSDYVYDDWMSRGGKDAANVPLDCVGYIRKRWHREETDWRTGKHKGRKTTKSGGEDRDMNQLEAKMKRMGM